MFRDTEKKKKKTKKKEREREGGNNIMHCNGKGKNIQSLMHYAHHVITTHRVIITTSMQPKNKQKKHT